MRNEVILGFLTQIIAIIIISLTKKRMEVCKFHVPSSRFQMRMGTFRLLSYYGTILPLGGQYCAVER